MIWLHLGMCIVVLSPTVPTLTPCPPWCPPSFGLAPAAPLQVHAPLAPNQSVEISLPLNTVGSVMKMDPLNNLQVGNVGVSPPGHGPGEIQRGRCDIRSQVLAAVTPGSRGMGIGHFGNLLWVRDVEIPMSFHPRWQ